MRAAHRRLSARSALLLALLISACGGGGGGGEALAPAPPAALSPSLPGLRASGDTPVASGCTGGSTIGTFYAQAEVEPFVAIDPNDANHLVGTWQQDRWSNGGARAVLSAVSFDGGRSWSRSMHPMSRCGGAAAGSAGDYERVTDPWVDIGRDGTVHLMALAFNGAALATGSRSAMLASRSLDGGRSFAPPQVLAVDGDAVFNDKNTLTVDALDPRLVYAVWDRIDDAGNGPTRFVRSTDAGASWEAVRSVYTPSVRGGASQTIGNRIVVLPAGPQRGLLVNAFVQIDSVGSTSNRTVRVIRSADKGLSWGEPVIVAEHRSVGASDPGTGATIRDGAILPAVAVAPDGTLWLAWQDARFSGGQRDAIALSRSVDGGATWSTPQPANRDLSVAAFTPTLAVRADGLLGLMHYDLRPDTADPATLFTAAWLVTTRDALTWAETPVWPRFDLAQAPQAGGLFLGDYQGLVGSGNDFLALLSLSSADPANRTDIYPLRISAPTLAASGAATGAPSRSKSLGSSASAAEFTRRQHALTLQALEARLPGRAARLQARDSPP